jgi:hypothetical protein
MRTKSWKVVILGPTGAAVNTPAFKLLYPFPAREEAEAHAECLRTVGMKVALCDERMNFCLQSTAHGKSITSKFRY